MSHFLFGEYYSEEYLYQIAKGCRFENGLIYTFDSDIDYYPDIFSMIAENTTLTTRRIFCITSNMQNNNSEDVIFPYDKYYNEELFPMEKDRSSFRDICKENLKILLESLEKFLEEIQPKQLRIYVVDGYDDNFEIMKCRLEEMIEDIYNQVIDSFVLHSKIYEIF